MPSLVALYLLKHVDGSINQLKDLRDFLAVSQVYLDAQM